MREEIKIIIIAIVAIILVGLLTGGALSIMSNDNNTTNETNATNDTNITNDTPANNTTNITQENSQTQSSSKQQTTKTNTKKSSVSQSSSSSSDSKVHKGYFTVSENEKGQNEGMEPGRYVEYYTDDGPIDVRKIGWLTP